MWRKELCLPFHKSFPTFSNSKDDKYKYTSNYLLGYSLPKFYIRQCVAWSLIF